MISNKHEKPRARFETLDAFRGLAALLVVFFHIGYHGFGGYLAVDFFFILSGFVIAHAYIYRERTLKEFVIRRIARLYPLHLFSLLIFIAVAVFCDVQLSYAHDTSIVFLHHVLMTHNLGAIPQSGYTFNYPSWSISVEFWVSIVVVACVSKNTVRSIVVFFVLLLFSVIFYNTHSLMATTQNYYTIVNAGLLRGFAGFLLGVLSYHVYLAVANKLALGYVLCLQIVSLFGALLIVFCRESMLSRLDFFSPMCFTLMVISFAFERGVICLILRKLTWLGHISYSVYLNHAVVILLLKTALPNTIFSSWYFIVAMVIIYSFATYYFIEKQCNHAICRLFKMS